MNIMFQNKCNVISVSNARHWWLYVVCSLHWNIHDMGNMVYDIFHVMDSLRIISRPTLWGFHAILLSFKQIISLYVWKRIFYLILELSLDFSSDRHFVSLKCPNEIMLLTILSLILDLVISCFKSHTWPIHFQLQVVYVPVSLVLPKFMSVSDICIFAGHVLDMHSKNWALWGCIMIW